MPKKDNGSQGHKRRTSECRTAVMGGLFRSDRGSSGEYRAVRSAPVKARTIPTQWKYSGCHGHLAESPGWHPPIES